MQIFYSKKFLQHSFWQGHPECPKRLEVILDSIKDIKHKLREPREVAEEELYLIHSKEYIEKLKKYSLSGASFPDNIFSRDTFEIAKLAASAARDAAFNCESEFSFALVRPPGHHAGKNFFAGFCYINNIAFAVMSLQRLKRRRILVIDIDYHAGNGSWDIFYDDPLIYFLDFHCDPRVAYPGTGFEHENTAHMQNVCFSPSTADEEYIKKIESSIEDVAKKFKPDIIGVSAGFDTFHLDPIGGLRIRNIKTYYEIGKVIASLKRPTFVTLEGGYCLQKLGEIVKSFLSAF